MEKRNIFKECREIVEQIGKANGKEGKAAAMLAVEMARRVLEGRDIQASTEGVHNFMTWVGNVENFTPAEISSQMVEFNKEATEAIQNGKPWTL